MPTLNTLRETLSQTRHQRDKMKCIGHASALILLRVKVRTFYLGINSMEKDATRLATWLSVHLSHMNNRLDFIGACTAFVQKLFRPGRFISPASSLTCFLQLALRFPGFKLASTGILLAQIDNWTSLDTSSGLYSLRTTTDKITMYGHVYSRNTALSSLGRGETGVF
ncbi:hypothetical protein BDZ89DRAFT_1110906 [Hymenopellis radicata]|nr:hypothetical protein BDZ89DRAFT_1110906 [Hymenopellis radicata]